MYWYMHNPDENSYEEFDKEEKTGGSNMDLPYFYCNSCGYEDFDVSVAYSRSVANGDICLCPECDEEVLVDNDD